MRQRMYGVTAIFIFVFTVWCAPAFALQPPKEAVLITAFGTSVKQARVSYDNVEKQVRAVCPNTEIRWAWTAHSLLKSDAKSPRLSTLEALARLRTEGYDRVYILSLHIIPGIEYQNMLKTAQAFASLPKGYWKITELPPLLYGTDSLQEVAKILVQSLPEKRKKEEAVVFVGHGTHHPAGVYYPALQHYLQALDKNIFVGTVEGDLDTKTVLQELKATSARKVWIVPLMTVAGDHALNDLFGAEAGSWKQTFAAGGMQVETVSKGLGENPAIVKRWVDALKAAQSPATD